MGDEGEAPPEAEAGEEEGGGEEAQEEKPAPEASRYLNIFKIVILIKLF